MLPSEGGHLVTSVLRTLLKKAAVASPVKISLTRGPEVKIVLNSNVTMTRGKACAQAVHAALMAFDVPHGRVVVLGGRPDEIRGMPVQVRDAGRTEIEPGTLTAGCRLVTDS